MTSLFPQLVVWVTWTLVYFEKAGVLGTVGAMAEENFGMKGTVFSPTLSLLALAGDIYKHFGLRWHYVLFFCCCFFTADWPLLVASQSFKGNIGLH